MAQTVVTQGPAFQSRPTFKLFHNDYGMSGIWTVGSEWDRYFITIIPNIIRY